MSYILDALKRSEQERHQDQMPSFSAENMILQTNQKRNPWWPYVLIAVLFLNALLFMFFYWNTSTEVTNVKVIGQDKALVSTTKPVTPKVHTSSTRTAPPDNVLTEHNYIKPLVASSLTNKKEPVIDDGNRDNDHLYGTTVDEGLLIEPKSKALQKTKQPYVIQEPSEIEPVNEGDVISPTRNDVSVSVAEQKNKAGSENEAENPDSFSDVPLLTELDSSFQRSIPDLTFNSHIYSDQETARRVMINNFYLREGQSFNGLELIEIGETHIKVSKNGTIFKLPVLRDWSS